MSYRKGLVKYEFELILFIRKLLKHVPTFAVNINNFRQSIPLK